MSDLRLILLLLGIGVILGVYAWTRFQQQNRRSASRTPPAVARASAAEPDNADIEQELQRMERLVSGREPETMDADIGTEAEAGTGSSAERLLVISVVAADGEPFAGEALLKAFEHNKLRFSDKGIFERVVIHNGRELPVFGVANLVKPGTFAPQDMANFTTPGLTLFLQLPCPVNAVDAFDDFVKTAERLAVEFGGELRDERHKVLTHQVLMQIRESIVEARFHSGVAS
ncbi:MAG: cell division protein ZipA [Thiogranum sp.]|nr:cell division protein ZipA [Thiogranum sp.]